LSTDLTFANLEIEFAESIADIGLTAWNELAGADNPFVSYDFLWALEKSGCTTRGTGWQPYHGAVYSKLPAGRTLIALVPMYLKTNSYGEYVFDWSWADAYRSHGLSYYPKLLTSIPFTPSVGKRILVRGSVAKEPVLQFLYSALKQEANDLKASSWHVLFPEQDQFELLSELGMRGRTACQFHWFNKDYSSFDDFLASLSSRKRKNIRKERQSVVEQNIEFDVIEGSNISKDHWQQFYAFYQMTYAVRGMTAYLNLSFFETINQLMPENLFLVMARKDADFIAGALFFKSSDKLYGRYWGCLEDYQFLHFETCYYQGQEYCIKNNLSSFDSGAQGEHKIQRGFEPIKTYSNHWIAHPGFADAIDSFLDQEADYIDGYIKDARKLLPFRKTEPDKKSDQ